MDVLNTTSIAGQAALNTANVFNGGTDGEADPYWQIDLDVVWHRDEWTVDYNVLWADGVLNFQRQTVESEPNVASSHDLHTPPQNIESIQVRYEVRDGVQLYGGISNLWYQKPSGDGYFSGYPADPTGRLFYFGAQIDMDPFQ
jgi:outer membrane receptor for ferrienterochelin and colicin